MFEAKQRRQQMNDRLLSSLEIDLTAIPWDNRTSSILLPQALQARLVTTGTFLGLEPKLLGSGDDICKEVCVPVADRQGLCPAGDRVVRCLRLLPCDAGPERWAMQPRRHAGSNAPIQNRRRHWALIGCAA
jgi:hypothetical protein